MSSPSIPRGLTTYWGQNSYGATHSDTANFQKNLSFYCQDDAIDAFPIAFLNVFFSTGGLPSIDLANICSTATNPLFPGTNLPDCSFIASDIETCQSKGKIVTISLGGATGGAGFTSASQASAFGDTIWNLFLGGTSSTRPFGSAVLDGIDLDIEGGSTQYFDSFVNRIRTLASGAPKKYYVTGAPQCPYPDAYMSTVLNAVGFDAVYVQFYNNYCSLPNFNNANDWDFGLWDTWAKTVSPNPNVKIYIGAPGSSSAAGSGYVDATTLANIALSTRSQYSSFGGVMLWDASQAYANGRFDLAIKNAIKQGGNGGTTSTPVTVSVPSTTSTPATTTTPTTVSTPKTTSTTPVSTTTASSGSCANVAAWVSNIAYNGGQQVVYNGHLWTAKWWSYADVPGGAAGDWTDDGACTSFNAAIPTQRSAFMSAISSAPKPTQ
ncbi:glycoside hydrolase [Dichomitus squalens LYAD-421 SS1]|uniref:chitinase n=1 Tax=Dichomitus squalens TaxID=114155 RepID=A0A4Q9MGV2_9APHY|nr:glycoside hydrolase [Dichomitus squalens LYAD-421 SS1]EJF62645.1 glycoside hydrolase [Dichomitus squalens LYAD-421 SS1]TBU26037.1 glycoside hydrolase [Dichomitus squalens]